jgi:2,4-dienoyl-CoA reductase-like NADH-dependent reductase (Old Yellow Enzyme family)
MARYFRYKSLDDLRQEITRLGLDLTAQEDLQPLFRDAVVAGRKIGNRLCIQPMEGCDADLEGKPGELTLRRYQRFGSGGAKLIWGEAAAVVPEGRANSRQLLALPSHQAALARLVDTCRQAHRSAFGQDDDSLLGLQLTHSGRYCYQRPLLACHDPLLDRRTIVDKGSGKVADESFPLLTDDDLMRLEDAYVVAARTASAAGFDFVDIKQCHRYLLNELLSARNRPGPYGGCYENRTRLARNIMQRIRQEVPGLILASRLNLFDGLPFHKGSTGQGQADEVALPLINYWGTNPEHPHERDFSEPLRWIGEMKTLGVAMVNVTLGNPYASPHYLRPFEQPPPDGYATPEHPLISVARHLRLAAQVQTSQPLLPVVGSGYSWLQELLFNIGAANVQQGKITFVGVGRGALAHPDFGKQLLEHGKLDRKRVCRTFSYCTALMRSKHNDMGQFATGCPPFDKEVYGPIWKTAQGS